jgi:hypothetical protein
MLIVSLFLTLILFIMGAAFLSIKSFQGREAVLAENSILAAQIAEAGMEDAKIKLEKDLLFPPPGDVNQKLFSYREHFTDLDGNRLGSYTVTVDITRQVSPFFIISVSSVGIAGEEEEPLAMRKISAEIDVTPNIRGSSPAQANPDFFNYINWQDSGSL